MTMKSHYREKPLVLILFGGRIRQIRKTKGWSQEKLAEETDLHRTYIGSIERGERNVSFLNIKRIADGLGVSVSELVEKI